MQQGKLPFNNKTKQNKTKQNKRTTKKHQQQQQKTKRKKEKFHIWMTDVQSRDNSFLSSVEEIVLSPQALGIHYSWKVVVSVSLPRCRIQQHRRQWNKRKRKRETWSSSFYCGTSESKSLKPVFVFCASNARWTFRELQLSLCLLTDLFFIFLLESDMEHKKVKYHSNAR